MKAPRYKQSPLGARMQRRIVMALLVAMFAMVSGFLTYPYALKFLYRRQLDSTDVSRRLAGLNAMLRLAATDSSTHDEIEQAFLDMFLDAGDDANDVLVRLGGWAVRNLPSFERRFSRQLVAPSDALFLGLAGALREGGAWIDERRTRTQLCRWAALQCRVSEPRLKSAAIHELAGAGPQCESALHEVLVAALADTSPEIRLAAVEAVSICLPKARAALLQGMTNDPDTTVRDEAALRLQVLATPAIQSNDGALIRTDDLIATLQSGEYFAQLRAIDHIASRDDFTSTELARLIAKLRNLAQEGLATNNGGLAGAALEALAELGDDSLLPVMLDTAAGHGDQPMLRLMAARAAARLEVDEGGNALLNLFYAESDILRDLAAIEVARLGGDLMLPRLLSLLYAPELEVRGAAAFALALMNRGDLSIRGTSFRELLVRRTSLAADDVRTEPQWLPRGYYLCSRLMLGDKQVRDDLEVFVINEHFPRIAIFTALLHSGETTPLDIILLSDAYSRGDAIALLRDRRFGDILHRYLPQAPLVEWSATPNERREQIESLTRWWSVFRWTIVFDAQSHVHAIGRIEQYAE